MLSARWYFPLTFFQLLSKSLKSRLHTSCSSNFFHTGPSIRRKIIPETCFLEHFLLRTNYLSSTNLSFTVTCIKCQSAIKNNAPIPHSIMCFLTHFVEPKIEIYHVARMSKTNYVLTHLGVKITMKINFSHDLYVVGTPIRIHNVN